jgi:hypothetical protein
MTSRGTHRDLTAKRRLQLAALAVAEHEQVCGEEVQLHRLPDQD